MAIQLDIVKDCEAEASPDLLELVLVPPFSNPEAKPSIESADPELPSLFWTFIATLKFTYYVFQRGFSVAWVFEASGQAVRIAFRFACFVMMLLPAFMKATWIYLRDASIRKDIKYGEGDRELLDIYLPSGPRRKAQDLPVIIFVSGGGWVVGYKGWACLMGMTLKRLGYVFVSVDYPNFPEVTMEEMVQAVGRSVKWTMENIKSYGGDPKKIFLTGQSAGANLVSTLLCRKTLFDLGLHKELPTIHKFPTADPSYLTWDERVIGSVCISGVYDLSEEGFAVFKRFGIRESVVRSMCNESPSLYSPLSILQLDAFRANVSRAHFPPILLLHGAKDFASPIAGSKNLEAAFRNLGVKVTGKYYKDKGHTDVILEDALDPNIAEDPLLSNMNAFLKLQLGECDGTPEKLEFEPYNFFYPSWWIRIARRLNPF